MGSTGVCESAGALGVAVVLLGATGKPLGAVDVLLGAAGEVLGVVDVLLGAVGMLLGAAGGELAGSGVSDANCLTWSLY